MHARRYEEGKSRFLPGLKPSACAAVGFRGLIVEVDNGDDDDDVPCKMQPKMIISFGNIIESDSLLLLLAAIVAVGGVIYLDRMHLHRAITGR